jgi:pterin-4a-carbinolamine dehydratase
MQLILKTKKINHSIEIDDDATANEFLEACAALAEAAGYAPSIVAEACNNAAEIRE